MLSNLGTVCLQFQELLVPKIGINASDARNCKFPVLGISDSETLERIALKFETAGSQFGETPVSKDWWVSSSKEFWVPKS